MKTATIRDLRNRFPKVKEVVEAEGEVIVTDRGKPRYRLVLYTPFSKEGKSAPKDYMARLRKHQPKALSAASADASNSENRGGR
jgi:antitoxin (DNA-binding transcriptional repressor) of toxin-antitoxin stability system